MTTQKYSVNQHLTGTLLAWVKSGEIAIPEIQRPFVWEATQVRDLLDSLYKGYPVGYIIVWKNPDVRLKDGSLSGGKKILIDGQQRITALRAAIMGEPVLTKDYKTARIPIAFHPQEERFEVSNPAITKDKAWIPDIAPVIQGEVTLLKLIRRYQEANPGVDEDALEQVISQLNDIARKQVGVIELAADLDIETVTEIFIRINREGKTLSQADFAMSKIAASETHGGHELRKAIDYFCHLAIAPEFYSHIDSHDRAFAKTDYFSAMRWMRAENDDLYDPSYSDMLRVAFMSRFGRGKLADLVALLSGRNFETKTYEDDIAAQSFEKLRLGVMDFMKETNFKRFLMIIKSAGFIDRSLVPAQAPLNFAYALYLQLIDSGYKASEIEQIVPRWFVFTLLTSRYSGQAETRFEQDIRAAGGDNFGVYLQSMEDATLSDVFWTNALVQDLNTSNSNHPAFNTFLAAQVRDGSRGFLSKDITVRSMLEHRGDVHHLFPQNYLKKELGLRRAEYNQLANYVYTQQEVNIAIGDQAPAKYMSKVVAQCGSGAPAYGSIRSLEDLKANLAENAVPGSFLAEGGWEYEDFLRQRRALMAARIRAYYESL